MEFEYVIQAKYLLLLPDNTSWDNTHNEIDLIKLKYFI